MSFYLSLKRRRKDPTDSTSSVKAGPSKSQQPQQTLPHTHTRKKYPNKNWKQKKKRDDTHTQEQLFSTRRNKNQTPLKNNPPLSRFILLSFPFNYTFKKVLQGQVRSLTFDLSNLLLPEASSAEASAPFFCLKKKTSRRLARFHDLCISMHILYS